MWRFVTAWQSIFVKWQGAQWKVSLSVSGDKYRHNNCISLHFTNRDTNRHEVHQFSHLTSIASSEIYLHLLADVRGTPGWCICRSCWTRWSRWSLSPARSSLQSPAHQTHTVSWVVTVLSLCRHGTDRSTGRQVTELHAPVWLPPLAPAQTGPGHNCTVTADPLIRGHIVSDTVHVLGAAYNLNILGKQIKTSTVWW